MWGLACCGVVWGSLCLESLINIGNAELTDAERLVNSGEAKFAVLPSSKRVC